MNPVDRDVWTIADVAAYLGCSKPHVVKLARTQGLSLQRKDKRGAK